MTFVVILDTAILAVPNYAEGEQEAEDIIFRLKHWADVSVEFGARRIVRSSTAEEDLATLGYFPAIANIRDLIDVVGLRGVYDATTVWKSYNTILNRAGILIDEVGLELSDLSDFEGRPPLTSSCFPTTLREKTEAVMASAAVLGELPSVPMFVASALTAPPAEAEVTGFAGSAFGRRAGEVGALPARFSGKVRFANGIDEIVGRAAATELWHRAETAEELHLAILFRALEIAASRGTGESYREVPRFFVGSAFQESLEAHDCAGSGGHSGVVLESCARIALNDPKHELKDFGRVRADGASALRTHVTKRGVGLRLMLWRRPNGAYELANVGPKNELIIEDGVPVHAYAPVQLRD